MTVYQTLQAIFAPAGLGRLPAMAFPAASLTLPAVLYILVNALVTQDMATDRLVNPEGGIPLLGGCAAPPETYDFVVVGSGSAGMIVATRLSNNTLGKKILLLEAGGEPTILNDIPSMDFFLLNVAPNTWVYPSTTQQHASQNCDNQQTLTTRGKMLGGSSSTNFMMYVRGNPQDFNAWATKLGDPQWNYTNVLPYFKKSENYEGHWANEGDASAYHGTGGLLNVGRFDYQPGTDELMAAAKEKGYTVGDYNAYNQEVFSPIDVTTQRATTGTFRESTYRAFYKDTGKSSNLVIKKFAMVTKVNFQGDRAVSVTYERHGCTRTVNARNEVILSAGVFNSPQILLLSGVGPSADLQALNIPVVKDLPVGENLQDHTYTFVGPFIKSPSLNPDRDITPAALAGFAADGSGPLAAPAGLAGQGFFTSPYATPSYPDLQVVQFSVTLYPEIKRDIHAMFGLNETLMEQWWGDYTKDSTDARTLVLWLGRPKSKGTLKLRSTNPLDTPIIDAGYLSHPDDAEALLYGFKKVVDLFENSQALNAPMLPVPVPGCEAYTFKSDDYYRCVIKRVSGSLYHHVGTCSMGAVVDTNLKVKGLQGIRVIDASVIPQTPNANTNAPTMMVGEKGADLILTEYNMAPPA